MSAENQDEKVNSKNSEFDLLIIIKTIWISRIKILKITLIFLFFGVLVAFLLPKEYTASTIVMAKSSESGSGGSSSLGGLASLAGINVNNLGAGSEIPPALYPKFVSSVTFRRALLDASFNVAGFDKEVSYRYYFENIAKPSFFEQIQKYTIGLPSIVLEKLRSSPTELGEVNQDTSLIKLSKEEIIHFKRLENQLVVSVDGKDGLVTISFSMPEPLIAAQMVRFAQNLLQKEVINYKISNAKEHLNYTQEQLDEKRKDFEQIQDKLARFRDRNRNITSSLIQNQLQQLESQENFSFTVFTEMARQVEQAKLQVSKDTPVFSIIQPVTVPFEKSSPQRVLILMFFTSLGVLVSLVVLFGKDYADNIRSYLK